MLWFARSIWCSFRCSLKKRVAFPLTNHQFWQNCCQNSSILPYSTSRYLFCSPGNKPRHRPQPVHPLSDNENNPFQDAQVARSTKYHKKAPEVDSSDSEPDSFLPDSLFRHQERQREDNHPSNMAPMTRQNGKGKKTANPKKKTPPPKRKAEDASESEEEHPDSTAEHTDPEKDDTEKKEKDDKILELQQKLALAQERVKRSESKGSRGSRGRKGKSVSSAVDNLVYDIAKTDLFKQVKFINNEDELEYATRIVMNIIEPAEHEGLSGEKLATAQAKWITANCESVRKAVNEWRNYVQGELQKYVKEALQDEDPAAFDSIPTAEEMFQLIMRNGLGKKDKNRDYYQWKFDTIWDELMSKVAGHSNWSQGKRHHGLMSFHKPSNAKPEDTPYVSSSDEAFLILLWENYYDRWVYLHKKDQKDAQATDKKGEGEKAEEGSKETTEKGAKASGKGGKTAGSEDDDEESDDDGEKDPAAKEKDPAAKKTDEVAVPADAEPKGTKKDGAPDPDEEEEEELVEVICPYSKPTGGAQRFGGWNMKGRKRFSDLVDKIDKNRKDQKKYLTQVETEALKRIRAHHNCDEREAKRKKKKAKVDEEDEKIDLGIPAWMRKK